MNARSAARTGCSLAAFALALALPYAAEAQIPGAGFGRGVPGAGVPGSGVPGSGSPSRRKPDKKQEGPETHAASGADDAPKLPTQEPAIPEDPLAISKEVKARIGSDYDPDTVEKGRDAEVDRRFYGLYYSEDSGKYHFKMQFPLFAQREQEGDRATLIPPLLYYQRRSKDHDIDIQFPLYWRLRNFDTTTTVVGPFGHREKKGKPGSPAESDTWLAPFVFQGQSADGGGYFHIPPLLTFTQHDKTGGINVAGPLFCKWRGGSVCDPRTSDKIDMGVAPFYFFGRDEFSEYEIFPPLLHYYTYTDLGDTSLNVWGPYVRKHSRERDSTWLLPIYYHSWGKDEDSLTLFPLFHKSHKGKSSLNINPLFTEATGEDGSHTFVTWGYAKYRGRTELDVITPFYWEYRDPDIQLTRQVGFPFFYRSSSPRSDDLAILPFYGRFQRKGVSNTTFVTPLIRHTTDLTGWETDVFPFFFMGRDNQSSHTVVAPFFWDFNSPKSRVTIALPAFFRFEDEDTISQLALNTFYREKKATGEWQFHFFPFVDFGETRTGHYWNLLYGLAGYQQEGTKVKIKALYFPIDISQ